MEWELFYSLLRFVLLTIASRNGGRSSYSSSINCGVRCVYVTLDLPVGCLPGCLAVALVCVQTPTTTFPHIWSRSSSISFLPSTHWHLSACLGALQEPAKQFNKECAKQSCYEAKKAQSQVNEMSFWVVKWQKEIMLQQFLEILLCMKKLFIN